ncbi:unnamed protein product [Linum tenue]|uniref:Uncharacterized protein n=1 Tax=Linum tenue TaxID=586396 RepID=A0AAV0RRS9_9ROSI|nr:unnamed protein product [Linum tenue]
MELSFSKTLNPTFNPFLLSAKTRTLTASYSSFLPIICLSLQDRAWRNASQRREVRAFAGRSKKKPGGPSTGRIEGNAEVRRKIKQSARRKTWKIAESNFYKLKGSHNNHPDNFTEDELNMMGLGYDRMVRFMDKDDPNLKHPYDWYKYGEFGPYSWRGVVIGEPIRGTITDECVTMYSETKSQEDWEHIEQHDMNVDFGQRLDELDKDVGLRRYWVFVRHPRWRLSELPWQQWTLVSEIVVQASKEQRVDKWNLMGRLGNKARKLIARCASWFRPDIVYVKRPVFQCRFEPQEEFLKALLPLLDPETEKDCLFELKSEDGAATFVTYFEGLCKIVRINQKAYVDDVVKAFEKLSDERKLGCLEFLLKNHPLQLLHPYTKEWKAKLEEMELGCDAPDEGEEKDGNYNDTNDLEFTEWIEDDSEDTIMEMEDGAHESDEGDDESAEEEEDEEEEEEENPNYWEEKFRKAVSSGEAMEEIVKESVKRTNALYSRQLKSMEPQASEEASDEDDEKVDGVGDERSLRGVRAKVSAEEWKIAGIGRWRKRIKKSKIPPELFLRAAVRPFTYRNLVKEIVLTRHAILDGEIGRRKN